MRAREVVLATGAIERPLVFPGNDRPGIMLAGAARTYLNRYGVLPGTRAVLVTACDEAYGAALELQAAGVFVACIADTRAARPRQRARRAPPGIPVLHAASCAGHPGPAARHARSTGEPCRWGPSLSAQTQPCDLVLMSGGYTPSVHLHSQSRGKLSWCESLQAFIPGAAAERTRSAGACRGVFELSAAVQRRRRGRCGGRARGARSGAHRR